MTFLVVSACSIPQKSFPDERVSSSRRIRTSLPLMIRSEASGELFTSTWKSVAPMEDLQAANELSDEPCDVEISNINLPEPRMAAAGIPDRPHTPTIIFTGTFQSSCGQNCSPRTIARLYSEGQIIFALRTCRRIVCRFLTNHRPTILLWMTVRQRGFAVEPLKR